MGQTGGSRLVLSRKGFDSAFGGRPSPILPDGRMVSLPIPDPGSDLHYGDCRTPDGTSYLELLQRLGIDTIRYANGPTVTSVPVSGTLGAHLDPDLNRATLPRPAGWRPLFGQVDRAQGILRNQGIGPGDLFLFFGLFTQTTELPHGRLRAARRRDWIHALWGWLEVDRVVPVTDDLLTELPWAGEHPHWRARHLDRYRRQQHPVCRPRTLDRSARRGQEFVVGTHDGTRAWIRSLLTAGAQRSARMVSPAGSAGR